MKNLNVLLVDDDEINRLVATKFLHKWDLSVTVATNGKEAIQAVQSRNFQLILMDLHMPVMDGYECTKKIRSMDDPYFKTVPIIAFSASSLVETKQKAIQFGMTDCIMKPFRSEELLEKIRPYLGGAVPGQPTIRPLHIDFDTHTDGDPTFKIELTQLLIENINELRQSARHAIKQKEAQQFLNACHKISTALAIINDHEFTQIVEALKVSFKANPKVEDSLFTEPIAELDRIADAIIKALEKSLNKVQNQP